MRKCTKCERKLALTDYYPGAGYKDGYTRICKDCRRIYSAAYQRKRRQSADVLAQARAYRRSPERKAKLSAWLAEYRKRPDVQAKERAYQTSPRGRALAAARTRKRRTTQVQYASMIKFEYGLGVEDVARMFNDQACRCPGCGILLTLGRETHIDHCHATGRVRGLLCRGCNNALGCAKDSPAVLSALIAYLTRY